MDKPRKERIFFIFASLGILIFMVLGYFLHSENMALMEMYKNEMSYLKILKDPTLLPNGESYIGRIFVDFDLEDIYGHKYKLSRINSRLKLLILFKLDDCGTCLGEYRLWSKLFEKFTRENLYILAICQEYDRGSIEKFKTDRNIEFPILIDSSKFIKSKMKIRQTPIRILVDDTNRILDVSETLTTTDQQLDFIKMIELTLKK